MTTDNSVKEPDIIIVGGGHSSADFIPYLCESLEGRIRGVVFIDHDQREIDELQNMLKTLKVTMHDIRLQKRSLERERFAELVTEMDMEKNVRWEDEILNHPPMIRLQVELRRRDIFDAVWELLPVIGGRLVEPRVKIVFAFGMTGMTSSTVAVESGEIIIKELANRIHNVVGNFISSPRGDRVIDTEEPLQFGFGLFPPDPTEGAGDFNLLHGLNTFGVLESKMPSGDERFNMENRPFDRFFFIDGSGFERTQNLENFNRWASGTIATLLTCTTVTGESFYDVNELLDTIENSSISQILVGCGPVDQDRVSWIRKTEPEIDGALDASNNELQEKVKPLISEESPESLRNESAGKQFDEARKELTKTNDELTNSRVALTRLRRVGPQRKGSFIFLIVGAALIGVVLAIVTALFYTEILFSEDSNLSDLIVVLAGIGLPLIVIVIIFFIFMWVRTGKEHEENVNNRRREIRRILNDLRNRVQTLDGIVGGIKGDMQQEWHEREFSRMWLMPSFEDWISRSENSSLPIRSGEEGAEEAEARVAARNAMLDELHNALRYTINPMTNLRVEVKAGTALVAGSSAALRDFPLPRENMTSAFGGDWEIKQERETCRIPLRSTSCSTGSRKTTGCYLAITEATPKLASSNFPTGSTLGRSTDGDTLNDIPRNPTRFWSVSENRGCVFCADSAHLVLALNRQRTVHVPTTLFIQNRRWRFSQRHPAVR